MKCGPRNPPGLRGRRGPERCLPALVVLAVLVVLVVGRTASAQDAQYWSLQYGTRSELLGGAVVGSPQDLSTTFYNPGGLAYLETQSFLLSARALEFQRLTLDESAGRFTGLAADRFGTAPSLVTGTFPRSWTSGTLAYSFLTRQRLEARIDSWQTTVDPAAGPGSVVTNTFIDAYVSENWGGLTWSRPVGAIGVGATIYGVYRSQHGRVELLSQPVPTGSPGAVVATVDDHSYWHARGLAKVGCYWKGKRTSLGITFTTPSVAFFGGGEAAYYRSVVAADSSSSEATITESVVVEDAEVTYRSPLSVALGSRLRWGKSALFLTVEWFDSVGRYRVMDSPAIPDSGLGSTLGNKVTQELSSVLNFAVGYEYSPRERLTFFGSFLTDNSAATDDPMAAHSFSTWDIYQITGGAAFTALRVDFTLGVSFAGGSGPLERGSDLPREPLAESVNVKYRRVKAFLGFEFRS